jgi:hypothetical protein
MASFYQRTPVRWWIVRRLWSVRELLEAACVPTGREPFPMGEGWRVGGPKEYNRYS